MNNNWFCIDPNPPKITDWLQALGAVIAVIAAIWGFIKLFVRDKNREKEIKSLIDIADAQQQNLAKVQALLEEAQKQTAEFIVQSNEMKESNSLNKKHLEILTQSIEQNKNHQDKLLAIKNSERKNDIRPHFLLDSSYTGSSNYTLSLKNIRAVAFFEEIRNFPESTIHFSQSKQRNQRIATNSQIELNGYLAVAVGNNPVHHYNTSPFQFELIFRDEDKNLYKQVIKRVHTNISVEQPEEIIPHTN
jgi:hypothetical protein